MIAQLGYITRGTCVLIVCIITTYQLYPVRIHEAIRNGDYTASKLLINNSVDKVYIKDNLSGLKPIHIATQEEHYDICNLLIENGADINATTCNRKHTTPIHIAAQKGNYEICKLLIHSGAEIDTENNQQLTPMHIAAQKENHEICKLFIHSGAKIDAKNSQQVTPIHLIACLNENYETCKLLINNGASPHIRTSSDVQFYPNMTPRDIINQHPNPDHYIVHLLRLAEEIHDDSQLSWRGIRDNNSHTECAKIALAIGKYDIAKNILDDAETYVTNTQNMRAELLLHTEQLRLTCTNTQQLDSFIEHNLLHKDLVNSMLHITCNKVNKHDIPPMVFKHILGRYRHYINGQFDNIGEISDPEFSEHRALRDIICKGNIHETATRIRNKQATDDEITACLEYAGNEISRYRDDRNNTLLHNIMYDTSKWPFIIPIARLVIDRRHSPYNRNKETPYTIAHDNNNTRGMQILADYHKLNSITECSYTSKRVQPALLQIAPSSNSTWPLSTIGSACRRYLAETPSTCKLPSDIKWNIIQLIHKPYNK